MRVVLLDNRDSFVWNLAQALGALSADVTVLRTDRASLDDVARAAPQALVVSPGPGRPEDAGISVDAIRHFDGRVPVLGVCLGHQALGHAFGGRIVRAAPCHGRISPVRHAGDGLFQGLPTPAPFARYHSLVVAPEDLPACLQVTATTEDGLVMGLRHRDHPTFGVQFHPESFLSPHGPDVLARFLELAA